MVKKFIFSLGILSLVIVVSVLVLRSSEPEVEPDDVASPFPVNDSVFEPTVEEQKNLSTGVRSSVPKDFLNDPRTIEWGSESYVIADQENVDGYLYQIFYFNNSDDIIVSLQSEPLRIARELAVEELIGVLGVAQDALCDLPIAVTVPSFVSEDYSGIDLGLGVCTGSVILP